MSYHFKNSRTSTSLDEPVYLTKFRTTWVLPVPLRQVFGTEVISEQILKVGGMSFDKLPGTVDQFYRFHKRRFAGSVVETNVDLDMTFEVNVNENFVMYPYNIMKAWCKLIYDPNTGLQSIKKDYAGSVTLEISNKRGNILRSVFVPIIFPINPPDEMNLEYNNEQIYKMSLTFAAENFTDLTVSGAQ